MSRELVVGRTNLTIIPGYERHHRRAIADAGVERAAAAARRREWGSPVTTAVCDHRPVRIRLFDTRNHEIGVTYHECKHCAVPLFLDESGRPSQVYRAEECGCVFPDQVCADHDEVPS